MQDKYTVSWLYDKGWTVAAAARKIGRTKTHVYLVLQGKRESAQVQAALAALPPRPLCLRERAGAH